MKNQGVSELVFEKPTKIKMKKKLILFLIVFLPSCAFSIHETPLNYNYSGSVEAKPENVLKGVVVSQVIDRRTVDAPNIIIHLINGHGQTTTGGYAAEKPVAEIVHNGIDQALTKAGYGSSSEDYSLKITINDFDFKAVSGYFSVEKITSTLSISVLLQDSNGAKLAKNTVVGKGELKDKEIDGSNQELVRKMFSISLEDAITQIVEVVNIEMLQQSKGN